MLRMTLSIFLTFALCLLYELYTTVLYQGITQGKQGFTLSFSCTPFIKNYLWSVPEVAPVTLLKTLFPQISLYFLVSTSTHKAFAHFFTYSTFKDVYPVRRSAMPSALIYARTCVSSASASWSPTACYNEG